jgi:hypothetical protein
MRSFALEWKGDQMSRCRSAIGIIGVTVAVFVMAGAAVALASGSVSYEAGSRAKPPYLFLTVSRGTVTKVRWDIRERCDDGSDSFTPGIPKLSASIKRGHFSRTVHYTFGDSPLGLNTGVTTVKGTISGRDATVKLSDSEGIVSLGDCTGSHTFTATETARFH